MGDGPSHGPAYRIVFESIKQGPFMKHARRMKVFTPFEVAESAGGNKYLGVLVAARYARELNALPLGKSPYGPEKLTTKALAGLISRNLEFRLVKRCRQAS